MTLTSRGNDIESNLFVYIKDVKFENKNMYVSQYKKIATFVPFCDAAPRSVVNVRTISNGFLLVSLVTTLVSPEEVCLPSFEVLNCWLNLVASCLDGENEIPLKVIASFSASRSSLPSIPLIVLHSLVTSVFWSMVSTKSLQFFRLCTQMRF